MSKIPKSGNVESEKSKRSKLGKEEKLDSDIMVWFKKYKSKRGVQKITSPCAKFSLENLTQKYIFD